MDPDRSVHWYMRQESQMFSLIPTTERNPEYDKKFHYLGETTRAVANRKAYNRMQDITSTVEEFGRIVGGTE